MIHQEEVFLMAYLAKMEIKLESTCKTLCPQVLPIKEKM